MVTDQRGYSLARYAMASALLTQTEPYFPHLFVHGWDGPDPDDGLISLAKRVRKPITILRVTDESLATMKLHTAAHITSTAYMKFAALEQLSDTFDRVLYADTDILFFDPIAWSEIDFRGNPIAAVNDFADCKAADRTHRPMHRDDRTHGNYFNSGLMAFDFAAFEFRSMRARYLENCVKHQVACPIYLNCRTADQCPFNLTFAGRWTQLPLTWNMQSFMLQTAAWETASVRHYTGAKKFLPMRPGRADRRERALLGEIAAALGDERPRVWPGVDLIYWFNSLRRFRERSLATATLGFIETSLRQPPRGDATALN